jgi:cupin 2 domain-containing protein
MNLFSNIPNELAAEINDSVLDADNLRIERIVSRGHASPDGFWYDQKQHEWVVLLAGAARLRFESSKEPVEMRPGDYVCIPAHCRHRIEWTSATETTIWLAVHYG